MLIPKCGKTNFTTIRMTSPFRKLNHDEPEFADSKPIPDYCLIIEVMAYLEIRREDTKMKAKFVQKSVLKLEC